MSSASDSGFWSKAHNKHKTRKRVVAAFGKRLPKTTILLPGVDIMCLKSIYYAGHIRKDMHFILVERDPERMEKINAEVLKLSPDLHKQCQFHCGELHDLKFENQVDFAYIDLLGNFTRPLFDWFRSTYLQACSPRAITFLTLQRAYRGNPFMRAWRDYVWNENMTLRDIYTKHKNKQKHLHRGIETRFYKKAVPYTLWMLDGLFAEHGVKFKYKVIMPYRDAKGDGTRGMGMIFLRIDMKDKPCQPMHPQLNAIDFDAMERNFAEKRAAKLAAEPPVATPPPLSTEDILIQIKRLTQKIAGQKAALTKLSIHGTKGHRAVYEAAIAVLQEEQNKLRQMIS
jgi:hypothetical protein